MDLGTPQLTPTRVGHPEGSDIPFNKPHLVGSEINYIREACENGHLAGAGPFTAACEEYLQTLFGTKRVLLVHSGTAALEMAALLLDIQPGDEIIMPSFTFVSTANAFVLRGGKPVFVDIRSDTLNLDETKLQAAMTSKTKAIVPVHYAGVPCQMDVIMDLADKSQIAVVEDAAQSIGSQFNDRPAGQFGRISAVSFHETKNLISGEGGALIINDETLIEPAQMIRDKGTNRQAFESGQTDYYTWTSLGSSYPPSELIAAFLLAQLEAFPTLRTERLSLWNAYHAQLAPLENQGVIRRPKIPSGIAHNAHLYYILLNSQAERDSLIQYLNESGVKAVFHYIPLHSSPGGKKWGATPADMTVTNQISQTLVRLPLWHGLNAVSDIVDRIHRFFRTR